MLIKKYLLEIPRKVLSKRCKKFNLIEFEEVRCGWYNLQSRNIYSSTKKQRAENFKNITEKFISLYV